MSRKLKGVAAAPGIAIAPMVHFHSPSYAPRCIAIRAGQTLGFMGDMSVYPLRAGVAPSRAGDPPGTEPNPIPATDAGDLIGVTFPNPGAFPFYAQGSDTSGMFGVVQVR